MPMYFFSFHSIPLKPEDKLEFGGAYVNCWIQDSSIGKAEERARAVVECNEWSITNQDNDSYETTRDHWIGDAQLEYYDQALIDGEVWVFHTYPVEDST
ncbi:MAG: hypothetical protein RLN78_10980 [Phycisphaerales bacterium]